MSSDIEQQLSEIYWAIDDDCNALRAKNIRLQNTVLEEAKKINKKEREMLIAALDTEGQITKRLIAEKKQLKDLLSCACHAMAHALSCDKTKLCKDCRRLLKHAHEKGE